MNKVIKIKKKYKYFLLIILFSLRNLLLYPQITSSQLRDYIISNKTITNEIKDFYIQNQYQVTWINKENKDNELEFKKAIANSSEIGLRKTDYKLILSSTTLNNIDHKTDYIDSLETEILITKIAIQFFTDIAYGNSRPNFGYIDLKINTQHKSLSKLIAEYISKKQIRKLIEKITPLQPEIKVIEDKIKFYVKILASNNFKEKYITKEKYIKNNLSLISKLQQLGIIESYNFNLSDSALKKKIKEAQIQFNLVPDGKLGVLLINELNIPIQIRLQQLILSLNYHRWISCITENETTIVVNIPAANLKVYHKNMVLHEMKTIVGKLSTPTPTLCSYIQEVVLYPYWHVPFSIASKELLPLIKKNPAFIENGNYQILNKEGKIIDPYSIDWKSLNAKHFPYLIRQSSGCDNALGLLKLNFENPFSVYLHDTPNKNLFTKKNRFLSHGCMRMERPMDIGHLVLKNNNQAIDTLEQKGCLLNKSPITVKADEKIPVIVWYNPAGIDSLGHLIFYKDVYGKFKWTN
jgi:murein L,D-transpeptidase YcbB/YkuD